MIEFKENKTHFLKEFKKDFQKLSKKEQNFVKEKLKNLFTENLNLNIKKLRNYPLGNYRIRFGKFRLIFDKDKNNENIVFIACRKRSKLY